MPGTDRPSTGKTINGHVLYRGEAFGGREPEGVGQRMPGFPPREARGRVLPEEVGFRPDQRRRICEGTSRDQQFGESRTPAAPAQVSGWR